jgi:hypothetical protein
MMIQNIPSILPSMRITKKRCSISSNDCSTIETKPANKKRKLSTNPVLSLIVGNEQVIYRYRPRDIIQQSGHIRLELMKSLMQEHEDPFTQYIPEVSPSDWELMIQYLDDGKLLCYEEAARIRPLYAMLGFDEGIRLCDAIIQAPVMDPLKISNLSSLE